MRLGRLLFAILIASGPLHIGAAGAQSTACVDLGQQLADLNRHPVASNPYADAIGRQQQAIEQAEAAYQRGCQQGFFSQPSPNCPILVDRIAAMRANLQKLQRTAPRAGTQDNAGQRERILAQMQRYRCGDRSGPTVSTFDQPQPGTIATAPGRPLQAITPMAAVPTGRIFTLQGPNGPMAYREDAGGRIIALGPAERFDPNARRSAPSAPPKRDLLTTSPDDDEPSSDETTSEPTSSREFAGSYKTLCVRTCDGFYFPISYSVSRNQFRNDADACHARCPQAETRLFVVKVGASDDGEQSYAADTGEAYSKLPNALRYRREVVNGCTCGVADPSLLPMTELNTDASLSDAARKAASTNPALPLPKPRPQPDEDPETLANADADFVPHVILPAAPSARADAATGAPAPNAASSTTASKSIRIVGPKFYADR